MPNRKREGNRPDRRILRADAVSAETREALKDRLCYVGSGLHKLRPGDYGFVPTHNPRPSKSACDELRSVLLSEARSLFLKGIELGMFSGFVEGGSPKYVWSVDDHGEVYEAKAKPEQELNYHGYRLGDDDGAMRFYVLREWKARCRAN